MSGPVPTLAPRLQLRLTQQLALTPQLRQALQLLQLGARDLGQFVERKLEENPFLERLPNPVADSAPAWWEALAAPGESLAQHLMGQIALTFPEGAARRLAEALAGNLDEAGYLSEPLPDLAATAGLSVSEGEAVLARLQALAPAGVGARSLAECLSLQLSAAGELDSAWQGLLANLPLVARGKRAELAVLCGLSEGALAHRLQRLKTLDPKPGLAFEAPPLEASLPDLLLDEADGVFVVRLNPTVAPRLSVDRAYRGALGPLGKKQKTETRAFLNSRRQEANWLLRALAQREETLLRVGQALVAHQTAFLREGAQALRPLTRRALAEKLELHESTISRVVANKVIATRLPHGTLPLERFFSQALQGDDAKAGLAAQERLRQLLAAENHGQPWSDAALAKKLAEEGFPVARRTVVKYRKKLGFLSSVQRRI